MIKNVVFRSNYRILGKIGQGQFGQVYFAIHRRTGEFVALKSLAKGFPTNRFLREFSCLVSLRHPNIVSCQAIEYHGKGRYLVMDYCEGGTLRDLMNVSAELSLKLRLDLIIDILAGLEQAHQQNIIHCDVKPENILLSITPDKWISKVTDFGIAKIAQQNSNSQLESGYTGSPAYMAPERFYGKYSYACDIYSVGIILYELMIGERPFSGLPGDLMLAHLNQRISIPDTVPKPLQDIMVKALEKLPQRRFLSAQGMLEAISLAKNQLNLNRENTKLFTAIRISNLSPQLNEFNDLNFSENINHVINNDNNVYLATQNKLIKSSCDSNKTEIITFNHSIKKLIILSQACLVLTDKKQGENYQYLFYYLSENKPFKKVTPCLQLKTKDLKFACDFQGYYLATITKTNIQGITAEFKVLNLGNLSVINSPKLCPFPSQLISLNTRYGLASFTRLSQGNKQTYLYLFNRRGHFIKGFSVPLLISQLTPNKDNAYELFGIETVQPNYGILIKLNPFKITRIPLEFTPNFIIGEAWGYGLADTTGKLLCLDRDGNYRGKMNLEIEITAMTGLNENQLLIAAWKNKQATVLTLNITILDKPE
ncbi:serine/threonine protein kinase [Crocosphaera subtropica ATCC 51142]|uniref:Serine/threonine protein kinase n=1 Tax=Crocosphaera subtropica (strain ATCC 51142 / BH68) TaxID=43989 RepID=B1WYK6_CROS5|nr:serine/threonine-protein kinase [Crocosphaera subtropica]ACB51023.1 serine/threonine protein kinase [Crocosphaera subtropica ATCC 51142]